MLQVLDAAALRHWCTAGLEALTAARQEIDDLNVYPVPDGDTGTNLQLTMAATVQAVLAAPADLAATVAALVQGSLLGARGNSGVILSQLLRGLGEAMSAPAGPEELRAALVRSAESAYAAVATPVEGTLLTVAREAAAAAVGTDLAAVVRSARVAAAAALARTPDLLPALRAAGVVDAGGRGWCVLLEALERVVTGEALPAEVTVAPRARHGLAVARESGSPEFGYEVQYLLRGAADAGVAQLKTVLGGLGDSLVVVGAEGLFNVHVHVNDVGAAIEAGIEVGRPFQVTVTRFADQVAAAPQAGRVIVAVASGAGLAKAFAELGAVVVEGGPTANPSTAELLAALRASGASEVVLLPNDRNVRAVAQAAAEQARLEGRSVAVVPTRSVVQGLAAASVADPDRPFDDDVAAMAAAAGATRWAELTSAVRAAETDAGPCAPGDVLGLLDGAVVRVGQDVDAVARELLQRLLEPGGELVTVVVGSCADPGVGERLRSWLSEAHPSLEAVVLQGDQPHYPLLLGVE
ncbi:MAG: Dak phosphatase [Frankiales bacterium]|nr:Dak phosphatase [Frankiales bacterium]